MAKHFLELQINNESSHAIIHSFMSAIKVNGYVQWADAANSIAHVQGTIFNVTLYAENEKTKQVEKFTLSASGIKKLYEAILEIEKTKGEEFWD